ncbi:MAG: type II secretion system F family protein [Phycisphaerales bacterium]
MASFTYQALTAAGERVVGTITAANQDAVLSELESRRLVPVTVAPAPERRALFSFRRGVSTRTLGNAYRQTADLLRAGVPLLRALRLLGAGKSSPRLAQAFKELADAVAEGADLADAMSQRPEVFGTVHVAMVRAGERGGFLEEVLARLARLVDAQAEMRSKVIGSLIYPAVLVGGFTIVLGLVFGVFIPMFRPMFDRMQDQLGPLTHSVLISSTLVRSYGWITLPVLALALVGLVVALRQDAARLRLERLRLRAPVIGPLSRNVAIARFARVLGSMLHNNVPMLSALTIAKDAAGSPILAAAIADAAEAVRAGQRLADPLARSGLLDDDVIEMIRVGEQANNLDVVLMTIADTLEARVDRLLSAAIKLIEPLMLLSVALVVAWVAMALILPMTRLGTAV